jgi:formate dehydrogenase iron-sulfur subunit
MTGRPPTPRVAGESAGVAAPTFIDDLLAEQRELTAVETFARAHQSRETPGRLYRELLPATPPAPGQQYAFEVNLDQCSGCKACVSACHSLNGLDDEETWRGVGLLIDAPNAYDARRKTRQGFQQNITTACHHCIDPACLNGCPVLAYHKDPLTGVVRHLDDQCIGCQYCVMMCPYEVPQYSKTRGIVRKCDMCHSRLAVGEAPACAQACPTKAIRITVVETAKVRAKYRPLSTLNSQPAGATAGRNRFLAVAPNPAITLPATRFVTQRIFPETLFAGDHSVVRRSDPHLPLVLLLTFSQLAAGASVAAVFVKPALPLLLIALAAGVIAMVTGSLHLGQPLKAWRSFLGWRQSWFSREVIALGSFVLSLMLAIGAQWSRVAWPFENYLKVFAAAAGLLTVTCSAMIYVSTRREFWSAGYTFGKFFGTTAVLGIAATLATFAATGAGRYSLAALAGLLAIATLIKLAFERRIFRQLVDEEAPVQTPLNKTARLLAGELNGFVRARIAGAAFGGLALPLFALLLTPTNPGAFLPLAIAALGLCVAGELIERYLFFSAVVTQKMPGGLAS